MQHFVTVFPHKKIKGFEFKNLPAGKTRTVEALLEAIPAKGTRLSLQDALLKEYGTEAHFTCYFDRTRTTGCYRVNKDGVPDYPGELVANVLSFDIDHQKPDPAVKVTWSDASRDEAHRLLKAVPELQTMGVYSTKNGLRLLQPLDRELSLSELEVTLRYYIRRLEQAFVDLGAQHLEVDKVAKDWTRLFRTPYGVRDGAPQVPQLLDLSRMTPTAPLEPTAEELQAEAEAATAPTKTTPGPRGQRSRHPVPRVVTPAPELPQVWQSRVTQFAQAALLEQGNWHTMFLALSGALLGHGVASDLIEPIVVGTSIATGSDDRTDDRRNAARTTLAKVAAHREARVMGLPTLRKSYPHLASAFVLAMLDPLPRPIAPDAPPASESYVRMVQYMSELPDGLVIFQADCGTGKSRAALDVINIRAKTEYKTVGALGIRAPLHSKTALFSPTNALIKEYFAALREAGCPVERHGSPLSFVDELGRHLCIHADKAKALAYGGQSVLWHFCEGSGMKRCERYDTCKARLGIEGDPQARGLIAPHALLGQVSKAAGKTAYRFFDEPPEPLDFDRFPLIDIEQTLRGLSTHFLVRYVACLEPALIALLGWAYDIAEDGETHQLKDAIALGESAVPERALTRARDYAPETTSSSLIVASATPPERTRELAPPLRKSSAQMSRMDLHHATQAGEMSRLLMLMYRGCVLDSRIQVRLEQGKQGKSLVFVSPNQPLEAFLKDQGPRAILDANAWVNLDIYTKVLGYEPRVLTFRACDSAPIERTQYILKTAHRKGWLDRGKPSLTGTLRPALEQAMRWALQSDPSGKLAIISYLPVVTTLRLIRKGVTRLSIDREKRFHGTQNDYDKLRAVLGPIMAQWKGEVVFGHYGGTRGLNHMKDADLLMTLGDPRPNVSDTEHTVRFLDSATDAATRNLQLAQAELEQAQGRLRTVQRTKSARALHVGAIRPSGTGWSRPDVMAMSLPKGKHSAESEKQALEEFVSRHRSMKAAAEALNISAKTLKRYLIGERKMPSTALSRIVAKR